MFLPENWITICPVFLTVNESYEWLDFGHIPGGWPVSDASNFDQVHLHVTFWEDEAKVFDHRLLKGAFLCFEVEVVFLEDVKDLHHNLVMLFFGLTAKMKMSSM